MDGSRVTRDSLGANEFHGDLHKRDAAASGVCQLCGLVEYGHTAKLLALSARIRVRSDVCDQNYQSVVCITRSVQCCRYRVYHLRNLTIVFSLLFSITSAGVMIRLIVGIQQQWHSTFCPVVRAFYSDTVPARNKHNLTHRSRAG